ncbi:pyridoxal phosphate-dependent decarboxylase family protein [Nocardia inohanensis]|uniref:pyridoxal phosphate-dependent decarboxylase family protein n=1 Tax=Nocardia inohanensis TaxID=209246 RepID=UPI000834E21C|nr:aminotransferase class V-fold PLP-dependent enzyme [Nocardia inohanensis]
MSGQSPGAVRVAGGAEGLAEMHSLTRTVLEALEAGAADRGGPLPSGGPESVAEQVIRACGPILPEHGVGVGDALTTLVRAVAAGSADPSERDCVGHLHCPPLAVSVAADLAASVLNQSMDSWDQAPAATVVEELTTRALAKLVYPDAPAPDALITSGGTESNLIALLIARERARARSAEPLRIVVGENAHHSVRRAAWTLGLPTPVGIPCPAGVMNVQALEEILSGEQRPTLVVATAGTTDEGLIDPLPQIADAVARHGATLHIDAAYGGALLFSARFADRLAGLPGAVSVTIDLHKLGWQPVAAGVLAVADATALQALSLRAAYLNADDDTAAGLPDVLGRSLRTSRRPDVLKIAATLRALGRTGIGELVDRCIDAATELARAVDAHPALRRRAGEVGISTVLFRPILADALPDAAGNALVAEIRRHLLYTGRAVLGRALAEDADGRQLLWLKVTMLHPHTRAADLRALLDAAADTAFDSPEDTDVAWNR